MPHENDVIHLVHHDQEDEKDAVQLVSHEVDQSASQSVSQDDEKDVVHLVNAKMDWHLSETASGILTDGRVSEDLQRDRVHQIVQWLRHFPERLPLMEALTADGEKALTRARAKERKDRGPGW